MTRYRLKKDLPILKTGAIFELRDEDGYKWLSNNDTDAAYEIDSIDDFDEWFEEIKESGWWKPKQDDPFWSISSDALVYEHSWNNYAEDRRKMVIGNCFKTREAAVRYCDYLEAIATVRQDEGVLTPEQINELGRNNGETYHIGCIGKQNGEEVLCVCEMDLYIWPPVGVILFDTQKHAEASRDKHPDEWKTIANYDWSRE